MTIVKVNGSKIKALREAAGLSALELANKVAVSQSMVTYIEIGIKSPGLELLVRIADYFGVAVDDFIVKEHVATG